MEEVKFRGKGKDSGEWVYGYLFIGVSAWILRQKLQCEKEEYELYPFKPVEVIPETVCQFIGLQDKNVKDIYKGDIVKCQNTGKIHKVEYQEFEGYEGSLCIGYEFGTSYKDKIEIIGNIYENPELLEKGE